MCFQTCQEYYPDLVSRLVVFFQEKLYPETIMRVSKHVPNASKVLYRKIRFLQNLRDYKSKGIIVKINENSFTNANIQVKL